MNVTVWILVLSILTACIILSYVICCKKRKKALRLSVALIPVPAVSLISGLILLSDYLRLNTNAQTYPRVQPMRATFLSEMIVKPSAGVPDHYMFYIQILFYFSLIACLMLCLLFIMENLLLSRKQKE